MLNDLVRQVNNNNFRVGYNNAFGNNSNVFGNNSNVFGNYDPMNAGNTLPFNISVNSNPLNRNNTLGNSGILTDSQGNSYRFNRTYNFNPTVSSTNPFQYFSGMSDMMSLIGIQYFSLASLDLSFINIDFAALIICG